MTDQIRDVVHVLENPGGWWDVKTQSGSVLAQFRSEVQARESGKRAAQRLRADLAIHQHRAPTLYWMYDDAEGSMKPLGADDGGAITRSGSPSDRKPLVLLVEDLVDARELYAQYLAYTGFSVVTAINGHEALRLARLLRPDATLMDVRLPGMDGLEATVEIKRTPGLEHIPVVAITADGSREMETRCLAAGCAAFIAKPALPNEVVRQIRAVLPSDAGSGRR